MMHRKHLGAYSELIAITWLLKEGYEVFRNVSFHGLMDIIAIKDDQILKLDVKSGDIKLSLEQIKIGVKPLRVYKDGTCSIDFNPKPSFNSEPINCVRCGILFRPVKENHRFCCAQCRSTQFNADRVTMAQNLAAVR